MAYQTIRPALPAAIKRAATGALSQPVPLLTPAEWSALKKICG